jgi:hypothetical protein
MRRVRRRSGRTRKLVLWIVAVLLTLHAMRGVAQAQEERWVVVSQAAASPGAPMLELNSALASAGIAPTTPVRIRLRGTVTDGFDGAEIDALGRRLGALDEPSDRWVVRPPGARELERDPASHEVTLEIPAGSDLRFGLNVTALATSHLVTASEMRGRLDGAIEVALLVPASAIPSDAPAAALAEPASASLVPYGVSAGGLLAALALMLGLRRRKVIPPELELLARARRAHEKLVKDARALGPQFEGVIAPGDKLLDGAKRSCAHLTEIDRSLKDTAFVKSAAAEARLEELRTERVRALRRLEDVVSGLEEAIVRLAHSRADRAAVTDIAGALAKIGDEVAIGREVDAELR